VESRAREFRRALTPAEQTDYDAERTRWLNQHKGYTVLRFTNAEVHRNLTAVMDVIVAASKRPPA
jgi:very-short-patch-repair endonuclease